MEQRSQLSAVEVERDSLRERLVAAKETMAAQENELQAKQARCTLTHDSIAGHVAPSYDIITGHMTSYDIAGHSSIAGYLSWCPVVSL